MATRKQPRKASEPRVGELVELTPTFMRSTGQLKKTDGVVVGRGHMGSASGPPEDRRPMLFVVWSDDWQGMPRPILATNVKRKRTNHPPDVLFRAAQQASGSPSAVRVGSGIPYGQHSSFHVVYIRDRGRWQRHALTPSSVFHGRANFSITDEMAKNIANEIYEDHGGRSDVVLLDHRGHVLLWIPGFEENPRTLSDKQREADRARTPRLSVSERDVLDSLEAALVDSGDPDATRTFYVSDADGHYAAAKKLAGHGLVHIVDQGRAKGDAWVEVTLSDAGARLQARNPEGNPACGRGEIKVRRKGYQRKPYTRSDGTRVKGGRVPATTFCATDRGAPGRGPDLIPTPHPGTLGGPGYTDLSPDLRHEILEDHLAQYGYASTISTLQSRINLGHRTMGKRALAVFRADKKWVQKNFTGKSGNPEWTLRAFDGVQLGYTTPGRSDSSVPRIGKGRKFSEYIIYHPEHLPNGKIVKTLKAAREYLIEWDLPAAEVDQIIKAYRGKGRKRNANPMSAEEIRVELRQITPREIVAQAAEGVEDPNTKDWIRVDREGTWEKTARELLGREGIPEQAAAHKMTIPQIREEMANYIRLMALEAQLRFQKKGATKFVDEHFEHVHVGDKRPAKRKPKGRKPNSMDERDASERLEQLSGGQSRAFRLLDIWTRSQQAVSGAQFSLHGKYPDPVDLFVERARRDGYSEAAIRHYVTEIQGQAMPRTKRKPKGRKRNYSRDLLDEIVLVAENDGNAYRKNRDATLAVDTAWNDYRKRQRERVGEDIAVVRPWVTYDLTKTWHPGKRPAKPKKSPHDLDAEQEEILTTVLNMASNDGDAYRANKNVKRAIDSAIRDYKRNYDERLADDFREIRSIAVETVHQSWAQTNPSTRQTNPEPASAHQAKLARRLSNPE